MNFSSHRHFTGLAALTCALLMFAPALGETVPLDAQVDRLLRERTAGENAEQMLSSIRHQLRRHGENDRLREAEATLLHLKGEWLESLVSLRKLKQISPQAMMMMAEALMNNEEKYEAAPWYLKAGRAFETSDSLHTYCLKKYLLIKPDITILSEVGRLLEKSSERSTADFYSDHIPLLAQDPELTLRALKVFTHLRRMDNTLSLLDKALPLHSSHPILALQAAEAFDALGMAERANPAWLAYWMMDSKHSEARTKSLEYLLKTGAQADKAQPALLIGRRKAVLNLVAAARPEETGMLITLGEGVLTSNPDDKVVHTLVIDALLKQQKPVEAGTHMLAYASRHAANDSQYLAWGEALTAQGKTETAEALLLEITDKALLAKAGKLLGGIAKSTGRCQEAVVHLEKSRTAFPEVEIDLAECAMQLGRTDAAVKAFEAYYLKNPAAKSDPTVKTRLASLYLTQGDTAQAINLFGEALSKIATTPDSAVAGTYLTYGRLLAAKGEASAAKRYLTAALTVLKGNAHDYLYLAEIHAAEKDWRRAAESFASALAADNKNLAAAKGSFSALRALERRSEAFKAAQHLVNLDARNPEAHAFLADHLYAEEKYQEALAHFRARSEDLNADKQIVGRYGRCLLESGEFKQAAGVLQRAIDMGLQSDTVFVDRARAYRLHEKDVHMAESILSFLLGQNPNNALALFWSGAFAHEDGEAKVASDFYLRAVKASPELRGKVPSGALGDSQAKTPR